MTFRNAVILVLDTTHDGNRGSMNCQTQRSWYMFGKPKGWLQRKGWISWLERLQRLSSATFPTMVRS